MNSGIYGMTSGQSLAGRKVKLIGGNQPCVLSGIAAVSAAPLCRATAVSGAVVTLGVRTRLLSIQEKGAVRFCGVEGTGSGGSFRMEMLVDGIRVSDLTFSQAASTTYLIAGFGVGGSTPFLVPDYIPFDQSFEVFITAGATGVNYLFNVDLHQ